MHLLLLPFVWLGHAVYSAIKLAVPQRHCVVFLSRQHDAPSRDFRMLARKLQEADPSLEIVTRCRKVPAGIASIGYVGEILTQMVWLARAKACVIDGHIFPVSLYAHRNLYVIQLWHALGAIKRFGYQAQDRAGGRSAGIARVLRQHRGYDAVLCGGPRSVDAFAQAFDIDSSAVLPLGLPRVDYLRRDTAHSAAEIPSLARLVKTHPQLLDGDRITVLYAPTFRATPALGLDELREALPAERFTVLTKPHDRDAVTLPTSVIDVRGYDILDLVIAADIVVTDYSAVCFEAAAAGTPVVFWVHDIDQYRADPGLNIDPERVFTESSTRDPRELTKMIEAAVYNGATPDDVLREFLPTPGTDCTSAIAGQIMDHIR